MIGTRIAIWGGGAAVILVLAVWIYHSGYQSAKAGCVNEAVKEAITTREEQNEVRNYRPDERVLFERLRGGRL